VKEKSINAKQLKLQQTVLEQFRKGMITIREGAELLGLSYLEVNDLMRENRIPLVRDVARALRAASRKAKR